MKTLFLCQYFSILKNQITKINDRTEVNLILLKKVDSQHFALDHGDDIHRAKCDMHLYPAYTIIFKMFT